MGSVLHGGAQTGKDKACTANRAPRLAPLPQPQPLIHVFIKIQRQRGKKRLQQKGFGDTKEELRETERVESASSEGGVHSSVELYNVECFVPLQFGADQVLLQLQ